MKKIESPIQRKLWSPLLLAALTLAPVMTQAQTQDFWQGGTGDFNLTTNWSLGVVPTNGYAANNDTGTNNVAIISATDPNYTINGFRDGVSAGGAFLQTGSTVTLGNGFNGWLRMGLNSTAVGVYTIMSNAVLNTPYGVTCGEAGVGVLNIWGGTLTAGTGNFFVVNSNGVSGTVNQTNGTVTVGEQIWIGQGTGGQNGVYNLSGGTLAANNFLAIGRDAGNGTFNMTGGTLNKNGTGNILVGTTANLASPNAGVGTLNQSAGTINATGQLLIPEQSPASGTYNLSGTGVLNITSWLTVGRGGQGTLNMTGGVISKTDTSTHFDVGAGGAQSGGNSGVINQSGGMITNTTADFWLGEVSGATWTMSGSATAYLGNLKLAVNNGLNCALTMNGGFLSAASIGSPSGVASQTYVNVNGGTIQASGSSTSFVSGLTGMDLQAGGLTLDTQGYALTVPEALSDGGGGGLVKIGSGSLTLSGANSYVGATVISNGTFVTTTASTGGGSYTVNDGTTFNVAVAASGTYLPSSAVTLGNTSGASIIVNLGSFGNPSPAPIAISGALTLNGVNTLTVQDTAPVAAQFPLITYTSLSGTGSLVLGTLPSGVSAYLSNNVANHSFDLVITSAGAPRWNGNVSSAWDILTTTNWIDLGTGNPIPYRDGEPVLFDDTANGTTAVTLAVTVAPGSVLFTNNVLPYSITGAGKITGSTGVLVEGSNTVTLATANTYTGSTGISNGTLVVTSLANGGSASSIGASSSSPTNLVIGAATLSYVGSPVSINRGFTMAAANSTIDTESNLTVSGQIATNAGSGFIKTGPATLDITTPGTNQLTGGTDPAVQIQNGTLMFDGSVGGQTNHTLQEVWIGDTTNAAGNLFLTNTTLNIDSWIAVGRGNGPSNFLSTVTMYNSSLSCANISLGYANGLPNTAQQLWAMHGSSYVLDQGLVNLSESSGSTGAITMNDTSYLQGGGQPFYIGTGGGTIGSLTISDNAEVFWRTNGNTFWFDIGNNGGTGSLTIQNNGSLYTAGDLNVTDQGTSTGSAVIRDNGVLNVNNMFVCKVAGSTGTLLITNNATVYSSNGLSIAGNATANGTVTLAGGTLSVNLIEGNSSTANNGVFNFNGGTVIPHGPYFGNFMYYLSAANVMAGGAKFNLGATNVIQITQALVDAGGGGGLTLSGAGGTLYLNGANTYTGTTVVGAGANLGGSGSIASPVLVASGGGLLADAGSSIGTFYIDNTLTLAAGSTTTMKIAPASNDQIAGLTGVSYGGALVLTNTSSNTLTIGATYKLFNSSAAGTGNFSSVTILPSGNGSFNPATGILTITAPTAAPSFSPATYAGGNIILTGTGGTAGSGYTILSTTNLALPLSAWSTNTTGTFGAGGTFSNAVPTTNGALFFNIRTP